MAGVKTHGLALEALIACPKCDVVYEVVEPAPGERATCARCHAVLIAPRKRAGKALIANGLTIIILLIAATLLPFLQIGAAGVQHRASIIDTALAFTGPLMVLSLAVVAFIIVVPLTRIALQIYVLFPVVRDRPPPPGARAAFRFSETLAPWSMAEIFAIGCAVALVKLSGYADVRFGSAFWMFSVLVVLLMVQDRLMCRYSVWKSLDS